MLRAFESRKKLLAQNEEKKIFYRDKLQEFESTKNNLEINKSNDPNFNQNNSDFNKDFQTFIALFRCTSFAKQIDVARPRP